MTVNFICPNHVMALNYASEFIVAELKPWRKYGRRN